MKTYQVDLDVTMSLVKFIEANNEEEAKKIALEMIEKDPYYHIRQGAYVDSVITDIIEEAAQ